LGCISTDDVNITFQSPPIVFLGNDTTICDGTILTLDAGAPGTWNTGILATLLPISAPGNYSVIVNDGVCISLDSINVYMDYAPIDVLPDSVIHCSDLPITLNAGENLAETFSWSTSETSASITPPVTGTYTLIATNYCGTRTENVEILYEKCEFTLFIPNSFTPNNDGINDVWFPVFDQLDEIKIAVFDRWGKMVFEGTKLDFVWTGNISGGEYYAPNGVYAYKILYKSKFGDDEIIYGNIVMSR
jgi:gliding motility-associated-like protein